MTGRKQLQVNTHLFAQNIDWDQQLCQVLSNDMTFRYA